MTTKRSRTKIALAATGAMFAVTCGGVAMLEGSAAASQGTNSSPAPATPRYGGADREATAIQIANAHFSSGTQAAVAVLARDDSFADALAGNALAAQKKGPLLVTPTAGLDSGVAAELTKILPAHATVYLLGGTQALSGNVFNQVAALGFNPVRLWGADRFETAVQIAGAISAHPHTVLVATGDNAPDALAAGAAAATDPTGGVVLLSDDSALPHSTAAYLSGVDPTSVSVYGVGGQGVSALNSLAGFRSHFTPLAGSDRYDTDAKVASNPVLFPNPTSAGLATGVDGHWPDALAGGAFVGLTRSPLLLADSNTLEPQVAAWLKGHGGALTTISVFGGRVVVPDAVVALAVGYATGTTPVPSPSPTPTPTPTVVPPTPALASSMKTNAANTNVAVTFDASKSKAGGTSTIKSYTFIFGDGTAPVTQTTPMITHAFNKTGRFSVSVTVTDADNATAVANIAFFVSNPIPQPPTGTAAGTPIDTTGVLVWAGIYDDHHSGGTTGTKPGPWCNGAFPPPLVAGGPAAGQVTFEGSADDGTMCGGGWDTPGIRLKNTNTTGTVTVNLSSVTIGATAQNLLPGSPNQTAGNSSGDWGGHWTAVTLAPGQEVIFAQWYDPSLSGSHKANSFDPGDTNNAGNYQNAADPGLCGFPSTAKATITVSVNGTDYPLTDRYQILNEHGVDAAGCPDNFPGRNDESTQWAGL